MRNPPERYIQTLSDHFAQAPTWLDGAPMNQFVRQSAEGAALTTNQAGKATAFQRWFHFKEAFAPAFVTAAIESLGYRPSHIVDPFGGSGTSAITAQLLDIDATTVEVNPFIADVIKAKVSDLTAEQLRVAAAEFQARLIWTKPDLARLEHLPPTFIEGEDKTRWIFPTEIGKRLSQYLICIDAISDANVRRFFRVVLGAILIECSNVYVNGKGRRYRGGWKNSQCTAAKLDELFGVQFNTAFEDVLRFEGRPRSKIEVIHGDSRTALSRITTPTDLIVFSPPYPNSFDYTDIYNVELWVLGYLGTSADNRELRSSTLRSHVQVSRAYEMPQRESEALTVTANALNDRRDQLWDRSIPEMVGAYFRDMELVLEHCHRLLTPRGKVMMVVGDSRYADVKIPVAKVLVELSRKIGFSKAESREVRQMRASAQQGGRLQLAESIIELAL